MKIPQIAILAEDINENSQTKWWC